MRFTFTATVTAELDVDEDYAAWLCSEPARPDVLLWLADDGQIEVTADPG